MEVFEGENVIEWTVARKQTIGTLPIFSFLIFPTGSDEENAGLFAGCGFRPALSVVGRPTFFKQLPPGRGIGYDAIYETSDFEWIANLTTGWSDGLSRHLSNKGVVRRLKTGELTPKGMLCLQQLCDAYRSMDPHKRLVHLNVVACENQPLPYLLSCIHVSDLHIKLATMYIAALTTHLPYLLHLSTLIFINHFPPISWNLNIPDLYCLLWMVTLISIILSSSPFIFP